MTRIRAMAAAAVAMAGLLAGCGVQVAGSAEPVTGVTIPATSASSATLPTPTAPSTADSADSSPSSATDDSVESTASSAPSAGSPTASTSGSAATTYPTSPLTYPATPSTQESANLIEARRLAGYVVPPTILEPTFTHLASFSTLPFKGPQAIGNILVDPVPAVAARGGMITGFSSARSTPDNKSALLVAAFEYPDAASAKKAATDLAAAAAQKSQYITDTGKVSVPGFPAAVGWVGTEKTDGPYAHAFLAQGSLVLYAWTRDPIGSKSNQAARLQKTFAAETKALTAFTPVPAADLMKVQVDPDGLRSHTVPNVGEDNTVVDGLYSGAGELHYDSDPVGTQKLFATAGVDRVSLGKANLYRARDAAGAAAVRDNFVQSTKGQDSAWAAYQISSDAPDASCIQQSLQSRYYCMATRGRYAIEASAASENDMVALLNAQYHLLEGL